MEHDEHDYQRLALHELMTIRKRVGCIAVMLAVPLICAAVALLFALLLGGFSLALVKEQLDNLQPNNSNSSLTIPRR